MEVFLLVIDCNDVHDCLILICYVTNMEHIKVYGKILSWELLKRAYSKDGISDGHIKSCKLLNHVQVRPGKWLNISEIIYGFKKKEQIK